MNKQDWYDMGAQIGDLVQSAVDNKDFRQLNQAITDTINSTVNIVQKNVQISIDGVRGQAQYRSPKSAYQQARENAGYKVERGKPLGSRPREAIRESLTWEWDTRLLRSSAQRQWHFYCSDPWPVFLAHCQRFSCC